MKLKTFQMFNSKIESNILRKFVPIEFPNYSKFMEFNGHLRSYPTFVPNKKHPIHNWFHYSQGFSKQLVEYCINSFSKKPSMVLDPFCGVGTTPITCYENGIKSVGLDISPLAVFISNAKLTLPHNIDSLRKDFQKIRINGRKPKPDLIKMEFFKRSFSEENLDKILRLRQSIYEIENKINQNFFLLALISILEESSNIRKHGAHYRFINNDNVGIKGNFQISDPDSAFRNRVERFLQDMKIRKKLISTNYSFRNKVYLDDARKLNKIKKFDAVITSPPYLNRDNYIAQSKLELFLLELVDSFEDYRKLTKSTLRSHVEAETQFNNEYYPDYLLTLCKEIKKMKPSYKTVPDMVRGYFQDLHLVLKKIKQKIAAEGKVVFVVGNVRYAGIVVPVDTIFSHISEELGFTIEKIEITRFKGNSPQQMSRYGKIPLRESIVTLRV